MLSNSLSPTMCRAASFSSSIDSVKSPKCSDRFLAAFFFAVRSIAELIPTMPPIIRPAAATGQADIIPDSVPSNFTAAVAPFAALNVSIAAAIPLILPSITPGCCNSHSPASRSGPNRLSVAFAKFFASLRIVGISSFKFSVKELTQAVASCTPFRSRLLNPP